MVVSLHLPIPHHIYKFEICVVGNLEGSRLTIMAGNNFFDDGSATFTEKYKITDFSEELYYDDQLNKYFNCSPEVIDYMEKALYRMCEDFDIYCEVHHTNINMTDGMSAIILSYNLW